MRRTTSSLLALVAMLALPAQAPAATAGSWCTKIPLPRTTTCRAFEVRTGRTTLRLAVAATEAQREYGLMNVSFVPPGQGMVFAFPGGDAQRYFWMKDTITPLDMVFVKADGTISTIAAHVPATPPKTPNERIARRDGLAKYVIELGAGDAGRSGLLPGMQLSIQPVEAQ